MSHGVARHGVREMMRHNTSDFTLQPYAHVNGEGGTQTRAVRRHERRSKAPPPLLIFAGWPGVLRPHCAAARRVGGRRAVTVSRWTPGTTLNLVALDRPNSNYNAPGRMNYDLHFGSTVHLGIYGV